MRSCLRSLVICGGVASTCNTLLGLDTNIPLLVHARYTRNEILAAFGTGSGARPEHMANGRLVGRTVAVGSGAFTLDKSFGRFLAYERGIATMRFSPELIHWESQSATADDGQVGQRYIHQFERGTNVILFARLRSDERAFWCLGSARYVRHEGSRPIAFVWKLDDRLPGDLYAEFAAAVA